jgi:hypothetical protein
MEIFNHISADGVGTLSPRAPIWNGFEGKRASSQSALAIIV